MILPDPAILVITDRTQCAEPLEARAEALFRGGCRWLSLREKDMQPRLRRALLERLTVIAADFNATMSIHDDLAAAQACRSALHLAANCDIQPARRRLDESRLIGKSCHSRADVIAAAQEGADYASLGPVFLSHSKPGYRPTLDLLQFGAIAAEAGLPVLALGGVTVATLPALAGSGVSGVAIMGEAMRTPHPRAWFATIAESWTRLTRSR